MARVTRLLGEEDDEEEQQPPQQQQSLLPGADGDELTQIGLNARQKQMLKKQQLTGTMRIGAQGKRSLRYELRNALAIVLAAPREIPIPEALSWGMQDLLNESEDEWTRIDPLVKLRKTISTGTCIICIKEVTPISRYLVARASQCTYQLQVTGKLRTEPERYDDNEIVIKPYRGGSDGRDRYSSFGLADLDLDALVGPEYMEQVEALMITLGPLSPSDVCDPDWIDTQQDEVLALIKGEKVAMKAKPTF